MEVEAVAQALSCKFPDHNVQYAGAAAHTRLMGSVCIIAARDGATEHGMTALCEVGCSRAPLIGITS